MRKNSTVSFALMTLAALVALIAGARTDAADAVFADLGAPIATEVEIDSLDSELYELAPIVEYVDIDAAEEENALAWFETISWGRGTGGALFGALDDEERGDFIYRAQSKIPPATTSEGNTNVSTQSFAPSSHLTNGYVNNFVNQGVQPPTTSDSTPYSPRQKTIDENSTFIERAFRYGQRASVGYTFVSNGKKGTGLGVNELNANLLFAVPCDFMKANSINDGYFLVKPNFTYTNLAVPVDDNKKERASLYDIGVSTGIAVNMKEFEGRVEASLGVASAFKNVSGRSFYARGRAWGALPIDSTGRAKLFGGIAYLDRVKYKLLPIAGVIYRSEDSKNYFQIAFPEPEWQHFLTKTNDTTDWWFFVHGEIGGGRWLVSVQDEKGNKEKKGVGMDYDDYRIGAGVNFDCNKGMRGAFELGCAIKREVYAQRFGKVYAPKDAFYLKANLGF